MAKHDKHEKHEEAPEPEHVPEPLAAGDTVKLCVAGKADECIANGPEMTVSEVLRGGIEAVCEWFGADGTHYTKTFHASTLSRPSDTERAKEKKAREKAAKSAKPEDQRTVAMEPASPEVPPANAPSPNPAPGATGNPTAGHSATGGPQSLKGEGEGKEAATGIGGKEGEGAAKSTKAAESKSPPSSHPSTPHGKGK